MTPLLLGATGLITGLITSLVGIKPRLEFLMWTAFYIIWFVILGDDATPLNLFLISLISGILHGATGAILVEQNMQNNPWSKEEFEKLGDKVRQAMIGFSIVMGLLFGGVLAGIAWILN